MTSTFGTLIGRVTDEQLRSDLRAAAADLRKITDFGLVFESHLPETVRLPHHPIRRGIKVTYRDSTDQSIYEVVSIDETATSVVRLRHPDGTSLSPEEAAQAEVEKAGPGVLIAVAEFGDPIYPGLRDVGGVAKYPSS